MSYIRAALVSFAVVSAAHAQPDWSAGYAASEMGLSGPVAKLIPWGDELVALGSFTEAGGVRANFAAAFNGMAWRPLGTGGAFSGGGFSNAAFTGAMFRGQLVAGGFFPWLGQAGGTEVNRVAVWNGSQWAPLASGGCAGVDGGFGQVLAMTVYRDRLYVAGTFDTAGCVAAPNLASWDGVTWRAAGSGNVDGFINALEVYNDKLIVGGQFNRFGGVQARGIVAVDDAGVVTPIAGAGLRGLGIVYSLASIGGSLYVGGNFDTIGGMAANDIARYDGAAWHTLGSGLQGVGVYSILAAGGQVYVAGLFSEAGGVQAADIASWNGASWAPLGGGLNGLGNTLAEYDGALYVGGSFTLAGGRDSSRIARWAEPTCIADYNRDGFLDFFDYADYVGAFESGDLGADVNGDHFIDFFDYADYVLAFETGC